MTYEGSIVDLIKDNHVHFVSLKRTTDGKDYVAEYEICHKIGDICNIYCFFLPLSDIGTATLHKEDKAIYYMRWIRKAIEGKELYFKRQVADYSNFFKKPVSGIPDITKTLK